jgi:folate-binding Fe-S cluster repair protein YgfZ
MHAVNFNKGCYIGQEIVERVRSRGLVHRLLAGVEIDSRDVPAPDTGLMHGEENAVYTTGRVLAGIGQGRGTSLLAPRTGRAGHDAHRRWPRRRGARST